ncbi:AI-2E family transporter [Curtobacterium sp. MCLR17_036]|uniref:AI-2E family transporter n=1 Tax=Curtobacterium sp. MCLR17_036 TaxID=2175620 RepID=UPI0015E8C0DC|nr:AI-2E family transporter [Curtobacterium sp. MCLR17_036]WIE65821.1 AI-2E family transporter [Curtobacterium sp. MCLR17_036]
MLNTTSTRRRSLDAARPRRSGRYGDPVPEGLRIGAAFTWRLLVIGAGIAVVVAFVVLLQDIVVPFLIALLVCALLSPMSAFLQRHRWPKWLAVLSSLVALVLVLGGLGLLVTEQVRADLPSLERRLHHSVQSLQSLLDTQPFGITTKDVDSLVSSGTGYLQAHASSILSGFQAAGTGAVHVLEGLFIIVFTTIFVLVDGARIWRWVVRIFPRRARARIDVAGHAGWKTLTSFIRVQLVVAVTDALGVMIGALALQIPLAIPIAVVVFLGAFVPVVGAIVAGVLAVVIALVFNGVGPALVMLGIIIVVQQLESHVLHPFLTGSAVKVHPLGVVLGVTAGTAIAGVVGAFFAVPFIATVNAMVTAAAAWRPGDPEPVSATVPQRERATTAERLRARADARAGRTTDHGGVQS